ncbi:MAG: hypothetical protein IJ520_02740, partial [Synergistaceae bacterium]|nr:hypothetical protein [Synergistaceae bacterium]
KLADADAPRGSAAGGGDAGNAVEAVARRNFALVPLGGGKEAVAQAPQTGQEAQGDAAAR